jgi:hypothetical protein
VRILVALAFLFVVLGVEPSNAQSRGQLICNFTHGVVTDLDRASAEPSRVEERLTLIFQDINRERSTANMLGNLGGEPSEVTWVDGGSSFSFVEVTPSGNVTTTSVFPGEKGAPAPAVHSRHIRYPNMAPVISQYFGQCQPN